MDMVESENIPTQVELTNEDGKFVAAKNFALGQNTQIIQDTENNIYVVGLKLYYYPKLLNFDPEIVNKDKVELIACGRKHYILTTNDCKIITWGKVFKEQSEEYTEGFSVYDGITLFDEGRVKDIQAKYSIFGALVEH